MSLRGLISYLLQGKLYLARPVKVMIIAVSPKYVPRRSKFSYCRVASKSTTPAPLVESSGQVKAGYVEKLHCNVVPIDAALGVTRMKP